MTTKQIVRRKSLADTATASAPVIDQAVIDSYVKLQDVKQEEYVKPDLETFLRSRYNLEPVDYSPDLVWIIQALNEYVKIMSVGSNSTIEQHGIMVGRLNLAYVKALRSTESVLLFDTILHYFSFYENSTFRAELPYRGIHMHKFGTSEQLAFFQHITAVAQMLADIQTRNKRLRELDFRGAIGNVPKTFEKQQAGLVAFIDYYTNF